MSDRRLFILFFISVADRSLYEAAEKRMRTIGTALEFGMELNADIEVVFGNLECLHQSSVHTRAADNRALFFVARAIEVVEFPAMTMALGNILLFIAFVKKRIFLYVAGISPESHRSAYTHVLLVFHKVDNGMRSIRNELA